MSTYAVILAAGVGTRMGADVPKQFVRIGGRAIIDYSLSAFSHADEIDEIIVVVGPSHRQTVAVLVEAGSYTKVSALVDGGVTRFESTACALQHLRDRDGFVLVHDAARPFLPQATIAGCVTALASYDAVATVVDSPDTIVQLDDARTAISSTLDRDGLKRLQTPQGFRLATLRTAVERAAADPDLRSTDDFTLVQRYVAEASTTFIEGDSRTFKITRPEDLVVAEAFAAQG